MRGCGTPNENPDISKLLESKFPAEVANKMVELYCEMKPYGKEKAAVIRALLENGHSLEQIWMQTGHQRFGTIRMYSRSEY